MLMNKKVVIAVVVLILALGLFFVFKNKSTIGTPSTQTSSAKSLKDLLSSGISQKCTFSDTSSENVQEGVTYVSKGKMRGDFTTTVSGKVTKSHMIVADNTSYIWTDDDKNGFKSTFNQENTPEVDNAEDKNTTTGVDVNKQADYKCSAWVTDESVFTPPADIKFTDLSQMFKPDTTNGGGTNTSQCSVCDSLSGDDKAQCKTALKCS